MGRIHCFGCMVYRVVMCCVGTVWFSGDHTKTIIVDDEIAFLGGMNIGREYRYDWHDMMVEIEGPIVNEISEEFHRAWVSSGFLGDLQKLFYRDKVAPVPAGEANYPMRLLYTQPGDSQILRAQIAATRQSRRYIYLQNPYITSDAMLYELVKARRRGVDARACLGSANMDNLSLRTNREMNLATSHPPAVDVLREQVFHVDMENSVELTSPLPGNWSDVLAELLADYL
ncbi:MAG: phosphatidylserine/phosphatidylglycerophosphate/cardiolipin synthase family protein [Pseudomonadota bacterium]